MDLIVIKPNQKVENVMRSQFRGTPYLVENPDTGFYELYVWHNHPILISEEIEDPVQGKVAYNDWLCEQLDRDI